MSKGDYLQIDFYLGRHLTTLWQKADFDPYIARPGRPVVVLNQENWERWQRELPPGLEVLDTIVVAGEAIRLFRLRLSRPPHDD